MFQIVVVGHQLAGQVAEQFRVRRFLAVPVVNRLDKSSRFLIIDTMSAAPIQGSGNLVISVKMNTFVREDGPVV